MEYKIIIRENPNLNEDEIVIETSRKNMDLLNINEYKNLLNVLLVKDEDKNTIRLKLMDISYFTSEGNNIYAICNGKRYRVNTRLYQLEKELHSSGFLRANNSQLVNSIRITKIVDKYKNLLVFCFEKDDPVFVSRRNIHRVKEELNTMVNLSLGKGNF